MTSVEVVGRSTVVLSLRLFLHQHNLQLLCLLSIKKLQFVIKMSFFNNKKSTTSSLWQHLPAKKKERKKRNKQTKARY